MPRRSQSRLAIDGPDQADREAYGRAPPGAPLRFALVRSGKRQKGLGEEQQGRVVHVRRRDRRQILAQTQLRSHLPSAPGGAGRLRVFRQAKAGHSVFGAQLLRRIRQRRRHNVRRRNTDLFVPDSVAGQQIYKTPAY